MADVNNKLRLQIVTQLDAAGIKATKEEVDKLELGLRRAGNSGQESGEKFGALEKALGKLPGPIGGIVGKLGGLAGQLGMVMGAFTLGVDIGKKIFDWGEKLGWMGGKVEALRKEQREYNRDLEDQVAAIKEVGEAEKKLEEERARNNERLIKSIDDATAAYFRQSDALKGLREAGDNAELQQLEREKYDKMRQLSGSGYAEAAEQVGKYYDILKAELKTKQEIAAFDANSVRMEKDLVQARAAYEESVRQADDAAERKGDLADQLATLRRRGVDFGDGIVRYGNKIDAAEDDRLEAELNRASRQLDAAEKTVAARAVKLENLDSAQLQRQMERANLVASGSDAQIRAADAYDQYVSSVADPSRLAQADFGAWGAEMIKSFQDADNTQRELLAEVRTFGDRLEKLLEVK